MENVNDMFYRDGRRQLMTGALLLGVAFIFIFAIIFTKEYTIIGLYAVIMILVFTSSGYSLVRIGYQDVQKSKGHRITFDHDDTIDEESPLPATMYIGTKAMSRFKAHLYDLDKLTYGEMREQRPPRGLLRKFESVFGMYLRMSSADYEVVAADGKTLYSIEKKGGFSWKAYVRHPQGHYVAYTIETKNKKTGQTIYQYIEKDGVRWRAEGDFFIGHFSVKDENDRTWATIKRGAINKDTAEQFDQMPGYLLEWKEREQVPVSLLAFLFLLQTRDYM
ncbi:hypothetical protein EQV77_12760 [Halobacillus fulvus]|nr:hypothetical protein EQV77_12760 [Halobacillus fulvus]